MKPLLCHLLIAGCTLLSGATARAAASGTDKPPREVTAVFAEQAPRIDGRLDDAIWQTIEPITDFIQVWPEDGAPATEPSEVRIAYDWDNLYFAFKFYDQNPDLIRAKNLERGGRNDRDDHAYIGLDTYQDGRNAYLFEMNALGTQDDATVTDEGISIDSVSWDAVFRSETVIDEKGWSTEVSIPFRQLRFPKGEELEFGLMLSRMINRKNERVMWPPIGLEFGGSFMALAAVSQYGKLKGLRNIRRGRNIEIKPYVITGVQESRPDLQFEETETGFTRDVGVDFKYGITSNLTLDLTVNTDFAQVEADNVQLNLSRFSLFFPEKREFFLERSGLFEHGNPRSTQTFFSRRIGLTSEILAGARVTGQAGRFSGGVLNIETGEEMRDLLGTRSANNTVAHFAPICFRVRQPGPSLQTCSRRVATIVRWVWMLSTDSGVRASLRRGLQTSGTRTSYSTMLRGTPGCGYKTVSTGHRHHLRAWADISARHWALCGGGICGSTPATSAIPRSSNGTRCPSSAGLASGGLRVHRGAGW